MRPFFRQFPRSLPRPLRKNRSPKSRRLTVAPVRRNKRANSAPADAAFACHPPGYRSQSLDSGIFALAAGTVGTHLSGTTLMSTLGKVLAGLNVLVALILFVFAGKDYAEARSARYAVFRHEMVLNGLPVDKEERWFDQPDDPVAVKLTPKVLEDVYTDSNGQKLPTAGSELAGPLVPTVLEELERVKGECRNSVMAKSAGAEQQAKLQQFLLPLAKNIGDREELRKLIAGPIGPGLAELD